MSKKISIDDLMNDIVHLQNQRDGLDLLLQQKKEVVAAYFKKSGEKSISNDEVTLYTQERTNVEYDIDALMANLDEDVCSQFIEKSYTIPDWTKFKKLCKEYNLPGSKLRHVISISRTVNKVKLTRLYEKGKLTLDDIEGCYTATVTKSIAIKMKNVNRSINLT